MTRKDKVQSLIQQLADEIYDFIKEKEIDFKDGLVPTTAIKNELELNFLCVPKDNKQYGPKGWVFAAIARILEDQDRIIYKKVGNNSFCKTK
jgi:phage FluMu gp28-like protein